MKPKTFLKRRFIDYHSITTQSLGSNSVFCILTTVLFVLTATQD